MGAHDDIDIGRGEAKRRQIVHPRPFFHVEIRVRAVLVFANTGVDQDRVVGRLDHIALERRDDLAGRNIEMCRHHPVHMFGHGLGRGSGNMMSGVRVGPECSSTERTENAPMDNGFMSGPFHA